MSCSAGEWFGDGPGPFYGKRSRGVSLWSDDACYGRWPEVLLALPLVLKAVEGCSWRPGAPV